MSTDNHARFKPHLILRANVIAAVRRFFDHNGFLEVETPIRIPAPAPEAYITAEKAGQSYLHTSPELCMKRLVAAQYRRIYQICRCFRKNERGNRHLPEFTLLEWYFSPGNYLDMMSQTEKLIRKIAKDLGHDNLISYQKNTIELAAPWQRLSVQSAFEQFGSLSMQAALEAQRFDEIMGLEIEPNLGVKRPVFLYDYPAEAGALARLKLDDPNRAERFELYIAGLELCNGFSELTDAKEQRCRFEKELEQRQRLKQEITPMPEKFLTALEEMPPTSGNALGLDRLVMLFADAKQIDQVVAFTPEEL